MYLTNAFCDIIPHTWFHIFAYPTPRYTYYTSLSSARRQPHLPGIDHDAQVPSSDRRQEPGNSDNLRSRSYTSNLLVKNPGHVDIVRKRNKHCIKAIKPLLTFKTSAGEYIDICFGIACQGLLCLNLTTCTKMHQKACGKFRNAPKSAVANIITWLQYQTVRKRIYLLAEAARLAVFQP